MFNKLSLRFKLIAAFLVFGIVPAMTLAGLSLDTFSGVEKQTGKSMAEQARALTDVIDRNLFERYGDVQAFGLNTVVTDAESWYKQGAANNQIATAMNNYAVAYGFYSVLLFVDAKGDVIAVNDKDALGNDINTSFLYGQNFAGADWFKDSMSGNFTTAKGMLSGTVVEDLYSDPIVAKLYKDEGLTLGFSAPVKDPSGRVLGVWKNFAKFSLVEDIVAEAYKSLAERGLKGTEITVLRKSGEVLVDYDPAARGTLSPTRDMSIIGKLNLAERGLDAAKQIAAGEVGAVIDVHARKGVEQVVGFAAGKGALGFVGMPWGVLVRAPTAEVFADLYAARANFLGAMAVSVVLILILSSFLVRRIVRPVDEVIKHLTRTSKRVGQASAQLESNGHSLAEGSTEQAAAIQETVASMAEMSSMVAQTNEHASLSLSGAQSMGEQADTGAKIMERMVASMEAIQQANNQLQNMANIINEISSKTTVINDIVFKTQLLSFNASIEAARAGQHGRGFAVVAEEVGNLAEMSGNAAKEIQVLLDDSKKQVAQIVEMTNSRVNEGYKVSKESLETFTNIAREIRTVSSQIESINHATREQETGITQTSTAMGQMDEVAQRNSALANDTSESARGLAQQSRVLNKVIGSLGEIVYGARGADRSAEGAGSNAGPAQSEGSEIVELDTPVRSPSGVEESTGALTQRLLAKKQRWSASGSKPAQAPSPQVDGDMDEDSFRPMS
jgi:hypothetical protein